MNELLTEPELRALDITVQLVNVVCQEVIGSGPTRDGDVREFVNHVHCIQQAILSQAAGRAYPDRFRTLGQVIEHRPVPPPPGPRLPNPGAHDELGHPPPKPSPR